MMQAQLATSTIAVVLALHMSWPVAALADASSLADAIRRGDTAAAIAELNSGTSADSVEPQHKQPMVALALWEGNGDVVKALADRGVDLRKTPNLWAHASVSKKADMVGFLLDQGLDPNCKDIPGCIVPPVVSVIRNGRPEQIERLAKRGADLNQRGIGGVSALQLAISLNKNDFVGALIKAGTDANVRDATGNTPLMTAAINRNPALITALVDAGADVNAKSATGMTPVQAVLFADSWDKLAPDTMRIVELLVSKGADLDYRHPGSNMSGRDIIARMNQNAEAAKANDGFWGKVLAGTIGIAVMSAAPGLTSAERMQAATGLVSDIATDGRARGMQSALGNIQAGRANAAAAAAAPRANDLSQLQANVQTFPKPGAAQPRLAATGMQQPAPSAQPPRVQAAASSVSTQTAPKPQVIAADTSWRVCGRGKRCLVGDGYNSLCSGPYDSSRPSCTSGCVMSSGAFYHDTTLPGDRVYIPGGSTCPTGTCNVVNEC